MRLRSSVIPPLLIAALAATGGCTVAARHGDRAYDHTPELAAQRRTAAVFQTAQVNAALANIDTASLPEYSRHDAALAAVSPQPIVAADLWPQPVQDSLERQRYIHLPTSTNSFTFFAPDRWRSRR